MRRLLFPVCFLLLAACGGGGETPLTLNGTWDATSLPVGNAIKFVLTEQATKVAGAGRYIIEAGPSGTLVVAGLHSGGVVTLEIAYDNGIKATFAGAMQDPTHMAGVLAYQGASTSKVDFVQK